MKRYIEYCYKSDDKKHYLIENDDDDWFKYHNYDFDKIELNYICDLCHTKVSRVFTLESVVENKIS